MSKKKHKAKNQKQKKNIQSLSDLSLTDQELETATTNEEASETPNQEAEVAQETATPDDGIPSDTKPKQDHFVINEGEHPNAHWYVVHTYSGQEVRVAQTLIQRVQTLNLDGRFFEIFLPTQEKIQIKSGKREKVNEKIFPGYMLVKMILDDDSWFAVRSTQGITGFVGSGNKPTPISPAEIATIRKFTSQARPRHKVKFSAGEAVRIIDGPFNDFLGTVDKIDEERGKLNVLVSIFGRETPVELDFLQVNKV